MNLTFLDKLIFRSPLLPYHKKEQIDLPAITEALYLASPVLTQEVGNLESGLLIDEKQKKKVQESIHKYYSRSCTRCTPFGLFAGVGTCRWGNESKIELSERRRETRLDMNYVCALGQYVTSIKEIRDCLLFFPNDSIYAVSDKVRYVDYKYIKTRRSHQISEVDKSKYLDLILKRAENGTLLKELTMSIVDDEIDEAMANNFVLEIVQAQLLKSELEPNVTGEQYFDILLKRLIKLSQTTLSDNIQLKKIIDILMRIDSSIKAIDAEFYNPIQSYKNIVELAKQLPVSFEENHLFQTDLYLQTDTASVSEKVKEELTKALNLLVKLSVIPRETSMTKFMEEFYKRYESEEVPLQLVLDTEMGIGYARNKGGDHNPLIDDIPFQQLHQQLQNKNGGTINFSGLSLILREKLREAYKSGQYAIHFTDDDFKEISVSALNNLPATFTMGFSLPANEDEIILNFVGGESATKILGRFGGGDKEILNVCESIIEHENGFFKDKIVAEIVHLPESRTGNILMRPAFREYEIPYLAKSFVATDKTIPLSDIMISVPNAREVILRSKRLNKEIVPRLSNAHNFSFNALPVYQFLCDLQTHNMRSFFSFDWGAFSREYPFKPRAVYGKVILKEATWDLRKKDIDELIDKQFDKEKIGRFLSKWSMPDRVLLTDADNTLLVEWYNELSFTTFINTVKKREFFTLTEYLFKSSIVKDNSENQYENEFLAFVINNDLASTMMYPKSSSSKTIQRHFPIGSEWLYYKLYTGAKTSDKILTSNLKDLLDKLVNENRIDNWFFIRYADPDKHLRLRLHIPEKKNYAEVIEEISNAINSLMDEKLIWKIQVDTYSREIERYGSLTMDACEDYFFQDSRFVLDVINCIEGEEGEKIRWITGFRATDQLLSDFGFQLEEKKNFMEKLAENFRMENGDSKSLRIILDTKFRGLRKDIESNLNRENDQESELKAIWDLLDVKSKAAENSILRINDLKNDNKLEVRYTDLIGSLIHMMLNRLFKSQQRSHELVIYDLLYHYYKSLIARTKKKNPKLILQP